MDLNGIIQRMGGIRRFDLRLRVQGGSGFKAESGSTDYSLPVARFTLKQMQRDVARALWMLNCRIAWSASGC